MLLIFLLVTGVLTTEDTLGEPDNEEEILDELFSLDLFGDNLDNEVIVDNLDLSLIDSASLSSSFSALDLAGLLFPNDSG